VKVSYGWVEDREFPLLALGEETMLSNKVHLPSIPEEQQSHALTYGSRYVQEPVPKYKMPERSMPANVAYQIVHDELNLDGSPALNLASFVTTWMEPEAETLMKETLNLRGRPLPSFRCKPSCPLRSYRANHRCNVRRLTP